MKRPPGAGKVVASTVIAAFLFPFSVAGRAQDQQSLRKSPHEQAALLNHHTRADLASNVQEQSHIETTNYKHVKDTLSSDAHVQASAVASNPLALAGDRNANSAVRAVQSLRDSGKTAGLSSPLNARSLQDWEVEDFMLLATVDGSIHARDRKTGAARWELGVDKPMVETIYHTQNQSERDGLLPEHDFLWIVEPSRDGDIYIYNQGGAGGLQKLHLTVKQLVADMSPYESADPAVVYNGEKRTKLYTVDAATGAINKVFGSGGSLKREPRCPRPGGLDVLDDEEECATTSSFVLGRTEYIITIQNRETTEPICTLKYSEWGPNTRDGDLHSQYSSTMDNKYVYPLHDGSIFGWDYGQMVDRQRSYIQKLPSPVVRVFDIARPLGSEDKDQQLVVLPQPIGPANNQDVYTTLGAKNRIFVNHTEAGGWFAMSEATYPLVAGKAKQALCYDSEWLEASSSQSSLSLAQLQESFVGVHALSDFQTRQVSGLRTISAQAEPAYPNEIPSQAAQEEQFSISLPLGGRSRILEAGATYAWDIIIILMFCIGFYAFQQRRSIVRWLRDSKGGIELHSPLGFTERQTASVPTSPIVADTPWSDKVVSGKEAALDQDKIDKEGEVNLAGSVVETVDLVNNNSAVLDGSTIPAEAQTPVLNDASEREAERGVRFQDNAPLTQGELLAPGSPQPVKKKARRGARGGAKHNKKKKSNDEDDARDEVGHAVKDALADSREAQVVIPKIISQSSDSSEITGPVIKIGHLTVNTDTILGYGGHGTMVYQGTFGGRDVAIKRMLRDFYDIASHEVGLLQESDDHPNVIRYYDKEEDSQFFYIALELCPASLSDVIEKPHGFPSLITPSLDKPEILKQITAGIRYLHSLKIVHRDIKPQNILVSAPKTNPAIPILQQQPRLLISDFGLCKKLEADQNSFRATTAHAAGTSGWRAPELLVDDDPSLKPSPNAPSTENSEPLVIDTQTKRSATRAIDIFSLGCIFYYCLTNGSHPFDKDGKFMREANIVKGNYDISALECLGDYQWEAKDLISSMLSHNPKARPDAATILTHPFFWTPEKRLDFLCQVSDGFEHEKFSIQYENGDYDPADSAALTYLESYAPAIIPKHAHEDFLRILPKPFKETLGKQRKYKGWSVLDLLRALRNKRNHYEDIPDDVKRLVGGLPEGYLFFWTSRFPGLLLECWRCVQGLRWDERDRFRRFYCE